MLLRRDACRRCCRRRRRSVAVALARCCRFSSGERGEQEQEEEDLCHSGERRPRGAPHDFMERERRKRKWRRRRSEQSAGSRERERERERINERKNSLAFTNDGKRKKTVASIRAERVPPCALSLFLLFVTPPMEDPPPPPPAPPSREEKLSSLPLLHLDGFLSLLGGREQMALLVSF